MPIDTTLQVTSGGIAPKAVTGDILLSNGGAKGSDLAAVGAPGKRLSFKADQNLPTPTLKGDTATYADVSAGEDLVVKATRTGFESYVVLKSRPTQPVVITIPVGLDGLTISKDPASGAINLTDAQGKIQANSPTALMWSAARDPKVNEPTQVRTVDVQIEQGASGPQLVLRPPMDFVSDPKTIFPLTIDPAATLTATLDTYVSSATPTASYSSDQELKVGRFIGAGTDTVFRSLIQFNTLPIAGRTVYSAGLYLYQTDGYSCGTSSMWIDKPAGFSSSTTWNTQPADNGVHLYNGSWTGGAASCPWASGWRSLDVRSLASAWAADNSVTGQLSLLAPDETNQDNFRKFASSETSWPSYVAVEYDAQTQYPAPGSATAVSGAGSVSISWPAAVFQPQQYGVTIYKSMGPNNWVYDNKYSFVSGTTLSTSFTGLDNGSVYIAQLACFGNGVWGRPVASNIFKPAVFPVAPTNVSASAADQSATITWDPVANGADANIGNYVVYAFNAQTGQALNHVVVPAASTAAAFGAQTTNNGIGLTNGQGYYFNVTAVNDSAEASPVSASTNVVTPGLDPMAGAGERSRFTTHTYGLTDTMSANVNVGTGNLVVTAHNISLPAIAGGALPIGEVYNSLAGAAGASSPFSTMFGYGWRFNLTPDLRLNPLANGDVQYISPSGNVSTFKKSGAGFTPPYGMNSDLSYASATQIYTMTDHLSQQAMTFYASGDLKTDADRNANTFTFSPPSSGAHRLTSIVSNAGTAPGNTVTLSYNGPGGRISSIDQAATVDTPARGVVFGWDTNGLSLMSITDLNGVATTFSYQGQDLKTITDPTALTTFSYDGVHRVTSVKQSKLDGTLPETTTYDYSTTAGHVYVVDGEAHPKVDYEIDPVNTTTNPVAARIKSVTDAFGRKSTTNWDADVANPTKDKVTSTINSRGKTTTYVWNKNAGESLGSATDPTGAATTSTYTNTGSKLWLPDSVTPAGPMAPAQRTVAQGYDPNGNPTTTTLGSAVGTTVPNPDGTTARTFEPMQAGGANTRATQYAYITSATNPGYRQMSTITPPTVAVGDGTQPGIQIFTYDGNGRVKTSTDGNAVLTTYAYDKMDRVLTMTFTNATPPVPTITKTYFSDGNLHTVADSTGTTTFGYDPIGRMVSKLNPAGSLTYTFDKAGNMLTAIDSPTGGPSLTTSYGYNKANEMEQVTEPLVTGELFAKIDVFGYNDLGLRSDVWYNTTSNATHDGNGVLITPGARSANLHWTYDDAGKLTNVKTISWANPLSPVTLSDLSYSYSVDAGTACTGEVAGITATKQSVTDNLTTVKTSYCYDAQGHLTSATTPGGATYTYGWDQNANRTSDELGTHAYNDADQIKGDLTVTHDAAGNQKSSTAFPLITYNAINQTSSITAAGQAPLTLAYAGAGQADRNQAGGTTQQNGSMGVQVDKTASLTATYVRDPGGQLIDEKLSTGESLYYYFDGLGSVIGLLDAGGNLRAKYTYDPFGAHATATTFNGALPTNPFRWMGGYLDSTGLYHFGERYYDSAHGRFLQADPVAGGSCNPYDYACGDPINGSDLLGTFSWHSVFNVGRAVVGIGLSIALIAGTGGTALPLIALAYSGVNAAIDCHAYGVRSMNCKLGAAGFVLGGVSSGISYIAGAKQLGSDLIALETGTQGALDLTSGAVSSYCALNNPRGKRNRQGAC